MPAIRALRLVASFALLGAVVTGVAHGLVAAIDFRGAFDFITVDFRYIGAALGAGAAIVAKAMHAL